MKKKEFKKKYFTNNFYWVTKQNYEQLQKIGIEFGCLCHTGKKEIIDWHDGFKNLGFRTYEKNNNITQFQKEPFLLCVEEATSFEEMLKDYGVLNKLNSKTMNISKIKTQAEFWEFAEIQWRRTKILANIWNDKSYSEEKRSKAFMLWGIMWIRIVNINRIAIKMNKTKPPKQFKPGGYINK